MPRADPAQLGRGTQMCSGVTATKHHSNPKTENAGEARGQAGSCPVEGGPEGEGTRGHGPGRGVNGAVTRPPGRPPTPAALAARSPRGTTAQVQTSTWAPQTCPRPPAPCPPPGNAGTCGSKIPPAPAPSHLLRALCPACPAAPGLRRPPRSLPKPPGESSRRPALRRRARQRGRRARQTGRPGNRSGTNDSGRAGEGGVQPGASPSLWGRGPPVGGRAPACWGARLGLQRPSCDGRLGLHVGP